MNGGFEFKNPFAKSKSKAESTTPDVSVPDKELASPDAAVSATSPPDAAVSATSIIDSATSMINKTVINKKINNLIQDTTNKAKQLSAPSINERHYETYKYDDTKIMQIITLDNDKSTPNMCTVLVDCEVGQNIINKILTYRNNIKNTYKRNFDNSILDNAKFENEPFVNIDNIITDNTKLLKIYRDALNEQIKLKESEYLPCKIDFLNAVDKSGAPANQSFNGEIKIIDPINKKMFIDVKVYKKSSIPTEPKEYNLTNIKVSFDKLCIEPDKENNKCVLPQKATDTVAKQTGGSNKSKKRRHHKLEDEQNICE